MPSTGRALPPRNTPSAPMYGGVNPAQVIQQNGQWGTMGRGGNFQALGGNALQRWLASQQQQQPPPPPPTAQPGYVTEQWFNSDPIFDWFRNSQPQGHNDYNAFNDWFHNFGHSADPNAWERLYGQWTGG